MKKSLNNSKEPSIVKTRLNLNETPPLPRRVFGRDIKNNINQKLVRGQSHKLLRNNSSQFNSAKTINQERVQRKKPVKIHENLVQYLKSQQLLFKGKIASIHINIQMRTILVQWIIQVFHKIRVKLGTQTIFQSIYIVDYMIQQSQFITINNLQLLGVTALFISSKYEEVYPLSLQNIVEATKQTFDKRQIKQMEFMILKQMNFKLTFPNRFTFTTHFSKIKQNRRMGSLVNYFLELSLLYFWSQSKESQISQAAVFLAVKVLNIKQLWFQVSQKIMEIAMRLISIWKDNQSGIISYIFDSEKYEFVGGIKIRY